MAVEVVVMVPILLMFALLVVAAGRYVAVQADMQSAARDAARAASFERSYGAAQTAASRVAAVSLSGTGVCRFGGMDGGFAAGGVAEVTIVCDVPHDELGLIGLSGSLRMDATGAAPIDTYRRTG